MATTETDPARPDWRICLLVPLLHFASVHLTLSLTMSPENEVVVWLPNAVLLAALLHWRGQRAPWLMAAVLVSDVTANLPVFPPLQAVLVSLCNQFEVFVTWQLMRRLGASPALSRLTDFGRFLLAGPLTGALAASMLAGAVLLTLDRVTAPYPTLVLLWWFGDALGQLIYTPLLLSLLRRDPHAPRLDARAGILLIGTLLLAVVIFTHSRQAEATSVVALTPQLLLIPVLFVATRCSLRVTALTVALLSLGAAWSATSGQHAFGEAQAHAAILRAQEYIVTLSVIGMGLCILLGEQRALARELEDKVRERTHDLETSNRRLAELSATDGLTGIANRRRFDEMLELAWARARRSGEPLALGLLDVDHFKAFNDHYGHQAGDDALRLVAGVLTGHVRRASDLVARYGGEEFAFLCPDTDGAQAAGTARNVCAELIAHGLPHARSPHGMLTACIGVAMVRPGDDNAPDLLLRLADQALYEAKREGRNRVVLHCAEPPVIDTPLHTS